MGTSGGRVTDPPVRLRGEWPILGALLLLVLAVRVSHLDDVGIWEDEAHSYFLASGNPKMLVMPQALAFESRPIEREVDVLGSWRDLLDGLRSQSSYGPAYYSLLYATMRWGGVRDVPTLKCWNVLFGILSAAFLWALARQAFSLSAAIIALLLYAFSPWDLSESLQLKAFSLATLSIVSSTYWVWRLVRDAKPHVGVAPAYAASLGLGLLSHAFVLLALPLHGAFVLAAARHRLSRLLRWAASVVTALVLMLPWALFAGADQAAFERKSAAAKSMLRYAGAADLWERLQKLFTDNYLPLGADSPHGMVLFAVLLGALGIGATGLLSASGDARRVSRLAGLVALGPIPAAVLYSLAGDSMNALWPRYFVIFLPCGWLAIAAAVDGLLDRARPVWLRPAALAAVAVFCAWQASNLRAQGLLDRYFDWRLGARTFAGEIAPGSLIVHSPGGANVMAFAYYWGRDDPQTTLEATSEEWFRRITSDARRAPIWFLLSWRRQDLRNEIADGVARFDYRLTRTIDLGKVLALRFDPYQPPSAS